MPDNIKEAFGHEKSANIHIDVQTNLGHGRIEKRTCRVIRDREDWISSKEEGEGLSSIIELTDEGTDKKTGNCQQEQRYYISDLLQQAKPFNESIGSHWGIENGQQ